MKYTLTSLKYAVFITCCIASILTHAMDSDAIEKQADTSIRELYHTVSSMPNTSMAERIDWFSSRFKGMPYVLGSLGEGAQSDYDQFPQYRVDGFDCDTFVNTVLALALVNSLESFQQCIKYTRYKDGKVSYINRNHFTSIDWNKNNQKRHILKDVTLNIKDQQNNPVAKISSTLIDKPGWYAHKTVTTIRLNKDNKSKQEQLLNQLKNKGSTLEVISSKLPYLPLTALFSANKEPNLYLFSQIPNGAIIEIVRPNWDLRQQIGTALDISHLGFAIRVKKQLYFREASSQYGKVVDLPLIQYLKGALTSPTIKGINIQIVVPLHPGARVCYP